MDIYLNGLKLDFRLEAERTLAEVTSSLESWLAPQALCIAAVQVDGRETSSTSWERMSLEAIGRLDVAVSPVSETKVAALRTARQYLRLFQTALDERNERLLGELAGGYPSMVEAIRSLLAPHPGGDLHAHLFALDQSVAGNTPERIVAWPAETAAAAARAAEGVAAAIEDRLEEWDDPLRALPRVRRALLSALPGVEEVSVLLQTGKDREAMGRVIMFSELTRSLIGIVSRALSSSALEGMLVGAMPLEQFHGELNANLRQLVDALGARDTVLIGDLLEYEIAPRVRELTAAAERIGPGQAPAASPHRPAGEPGSHGHAG